MTTQQTICGHLQTAFVSSPRPAPFRKFTYKGVQYTIRYMDNENDEALIESEKYGNEWITIDELNKIV